MNINQLIFGTLLLLLTACGSDTTVQDQKALLEGRWNLIEGQRNGKVTDSLRDTYFEFEDGNKMSTNLPIKGGMNSPYDIVDNAIVQTIVNDIQIKYQIVELTPQALKLTTNLRGFDFVFSMEKANVESLSSL
ncbi:MAG: hypothetical protein AB8G86_04245 [Saprospiraceae bacterium]